MIGKLSLRLREAAHPGDFTWSQKSVLTRLEREGPATVTTLARAEGVRPQSMGATMAVTTFDLKTALVVIDLQNGIVFVANRTLDQRACEARQRVG